jgi:hypothetical protein
MLLLADPRRAERSGDGSSWMSMGGASWGVGTVGEAFAAERRAEVAAVRRATRSRRSVLSDTVGNPSLKTRLCGARG